jgi:hypothetical protein
MMTLSFHKLDQSPVIDLPNITAARQELVRMLIGDTLQPGLHGLLKHAGEVLSVQSQETVLFCAAEPVDGAVLLARTFNCRVHALATRPEARMQTELLERGRQRLSNAGVAEIVTLGAASLEDLTQLDACYDVLLTEGSFAAAGNKFAAAEAMTAVLRSDGRIGLAEPTIYLDLMPDELRPLFVRLPFLAGARPAPVYRSMLGESGLTAFVTEDRRIDLQRALNALQNKLQPSDDPVTSDDEIPRSVYEEADDVAASLRIALRILSLLDQGVASYVLISAEKP